MDENQSLQLLGFSPNRMKLRGGQFFPIDAAPDGEASHPELLHAFFDLLHGQCGMLQGDGTQTYETVRVGRTKRGNLFVLDLNDLAGEVEVRPIPKWVDA